MNSDFGLTATPVAPPFSAAAGSTSVSNVAPTSAPVIPTLWDHQRRAVTAALAARKGFALFMDMGTGKTATAVTVCRHKMAAAGRHLRTLVICPVVMCETWRREFKTWSRLGDRATVLKGAGKKRVATLADAVKRHDGAPVVITNYEALSMSELYKALLAWGPELVIFDESHRLKKHNGKRAKAAAALADRAGYRLALTGTPVLQNIADLWSQYRCMDGGETFGQNYYVYQARYMVDKNAGMPKAKHFPNWQPRDSMLPELSAIMGRTSFRVTKAECLTLPPFLRQVVPVEMGDGQRRAYEEMEADLLAYLAGSAATATIALTKVLRMSQILSGHVPLEDGRVHTFADSQRIDGAMDLLADALAGGHKVILWSCFKHEQAALVARLEADGVPHRVLLGGMTDKDRQEGIDAFQTDPGVRVMVASQAAGGVGVTLTSASVAVYVSRSWNLEHDLQSEARCYRGGSEVHQSVTRYDLVAPGTVDERVLEALRAKKQLGDNLLDVAALLNK